MSQPESWRVVLVGMLRKLLGSKCSQHACVNHASQLDPVAAGTDKQDKQLWNAAMMAHMTGNSQPALLETWQWAQQSGHEWRVTHSQCYTCIAQGLACESAMAMQGQLEQLSLGVASHTLLWPAS